MSHTRQHYATIARTFGASATPVSALVTVCLASFVALMAVLALYAVGLNGVVALRDASVSDGVEAGLISNVGILLMSLAASVAFISAAAVKRMRFIGIGLFCAVFAADDAFMIHETFEHGEVVIYAGYALALTAVWYAYARAEDRLFIWPLVLVFAAFGASAVVDLTYHPLFDALGLLHVSPIHALGFIIEDVLKFGGLALLAMFVIGDLADALGRQ